MLFRSVADADAWRNCEISGKTFKAGLSKYFNDQVRVLSVKLSVDTEARTATFEGTAEAEAAASECDMQQRAQLLLLPARMHT